MTELRIVVADDNQFMRTAYKRILDTQDDFEVVGVASDGQEALAMALELTPDVAVLDVRMPKLDGIAVALSITAKYPTTGIVLISAYDDLAFASAIMTGGAARKAYILKNSLDDISELIRVVEAVASGQSVLDGAIVQNLMRIFHRQPAAQSAALTDSEEGVLRLILEGYDESEISQSLGLPLDPVSDFTMSICEKLKISSSNGPNRSPQVVQAMVNFCVP